MFQGAGANHTSAVQKRALIDIHNAFGWNGGLRRPTRSLDNEAWWLNTESSGRMQVFEALSARYQSDNEIKALFELARSSGHPYTLPCKAQPGNRTHRYQVHARKPFRVRCSDHDCQHKLQRAALVHWIAELVQEGIIDRAVFDLEGGEGVVPRAGARLGGQN